MIISLAQRRYPGQKLHQIGFVIYAANDTDVYDAEYFSATSAIATSGTFINYREIFGRFSLPFGAFIVVPATFKPDINAEFLLRIFSQDKANLEELK